MGKIDVHRIFKIMELNWTELQCDQCNAKQVSLFKDDSGNILCRPCLFAATSEDLEHAQDLKTLHGGEAQ